MNRQTFFLAPMMAAIDGWSYRDEASDRELTIHRPNLISTNDRSVVLVAERHWRGPFVGAQAPLMDHVVLKARWPEFDNGVIYAHRFDAIASEARRRQELGRLPSIGSMSHCISIPMERMHGPMERMYGHFEIIPDAKISLLVTPLRQESFGGTAPITLAAALPRYGTNTERELSNWFVLALALTRALWAIHDKGYAHGDIKPENIVLRSDHGYWRDIALIDFEHVVKDRVTRVGNSRGTWLYFRPERIYSDEYVSSYAREDVYVLGVTLLEVLRGGEWRARVLRDTASGKECAREYPAEMRQWAQTRHDGEPEIRSRARQICYRHLLHDRALGMNHDDREATFAALDGFLCAIEKLRIRQHRWHLHTVGTGSMREPAPELLGEEMLMELRSLIHLASRNELGDWCRRYVMAPAEAMDAFEQESGDPRPDPHLAPSDAVCYGVDLLRAGYGHAAQVWFESLLRDHAAGLEVDESIRVLRLLAGVLLIRTRDHDKARAYLAQYEHAAEPTIQWWARTLRQKLAHHSREPFPYKPDELERPPSHRARLWLRVTKALPVLRGGKVPPDMAPELRGAMSGAQSMYETSVAALYMARAYASESTPSAWRRAMCTLSMAAKHAVTGRLPYEYAASLCEAARLVCRAFDDQTLGRALHTRGFDDEEALVIAGRCAALAAEIYHHLNAPHANVAALEQAAKAYLRCPSPERRTEGIRYRSLAESNAALWPTKNPRGRARTPERMPDAIEQWRQAYTERQQSAVANDPAAALAHHFYGRYSHLLRSLWDGQSGLAVEFLDATRADAQGSQQSETTMARGAATARLLKMWHTHRESQVIGMKLLDVGCGVGIDAATLVDNEPSIDSALGIDISEWHIQQARARYDQFEPTRLAFERVDFTEVNERYPEQFHLALARDSLYHATDRAAALRSIRQSLRPGGYLLATDWVQLKPALPTQMRRLASTVWLTSMQPLVTYDALLREAGFEWKWHRLEPEAMHDFFCAAAEKERRKQAENSDSAALDHYDRIRTMLATLMEMSDPDQGIISWLFLVAQAV